jgi:hypothetical protein
LASNRLLGPTPRKTSRQPANGPSPETRHGVSSPQGYGENKTFVIPETMSMRALQNSVSRWNERLQNPDADLVHKNGSHPAILQEYIAEHYSSIKPSRKPFSYIFASETRCELRTKTKLCIQPEFTNDAPKTTAPDLAPRAR